MANFSESNTIENIILLPTIFKRATPSVKNQVTRYYQPRRQVRYVIRHYPRDHKYGIFKRFNRDQNRKIIENIRTRTRKKRQHEIIIPSNRRTIRLKSKTGFFLEILPNGKVRGHVNKTKYSKFAFFFR